MSFILSANRENGPLEMMRSFAAYRIYLAELSANFPPGALQIGAI